MPATSDQLGGSDDLVLLTMKGQQFRLATSYAVRSGIFTQPSDFSLELGPAARFTEVLAYAPPNTPFTLSVNGVLQFEGRTDMPGDHGDGNKSAVKMQGRDILAPLHDGNVANEQTLEDKSPIEIVQMGLAANGMTATIALDNTAGLKRAGVPVVLLNAKARGDARPKHRRRAAKCGETWWAVCQRELAHAGLFLWAAPGNIIVLSAPDPNKASVTRLYRSAGVNDPLTGNTTWTGNIKAHDYELGTVGRFSKCQVFGRGGGLKYGNVLNEGEFVDPEMVGWGFTRLKTVKDVNVGSDEEAAFYARRKIAESRRQGYRHSYTVRGHTFDAKDGSGRGVWSPDIMVDVADDHLGVHGAFWVETVEFHNAEGSGTTTTLRLLRPEDLVFGADEEIA